VPPPPAHSLAGLSGRIPGSARPILPLQSTLPLRRARRGSGLRRIQDRGYLDAAVRQDAPGFGFRDPVSGTLAGLEIDLAREVARTIFGHPEAVRFHAVGSPARLSRLHWLQRRLDPLLKQYSVLTSALLSNWWYLGLAGRLPAFLCPESCHGQLDFVGFDYYWGIPSLRLNRVQHLLAASVGHYDLAPVWPGGLYDLLQYHAELFPKLPIFVVENGSVHVADGIARPAYLEQHVREVQRAVKRGVNVVGYVCWSITSNREWGLPFKAGSDFGLYHIDLDHDPALRRVPTPSAEAYRKIIANRGA
jgi:hypothetical protein